MFIHSSGKRHRLSQRIHHILGGYILASVKCVVQSANNGLFNLSATEIVTQFSECFNIKTGSVSSALAR